MALLRRRSISAMKEAHGFEMAGKTRRRQKGANSDFIACGGAALVIVIPTGQEGGEMDGDGAIRCRSVSDDTGRTKEEALEQRLAAVLAQGVGIGKVEVMITLKSDGRQIVEKMWSSSRILLIRRHRQEAAVAGRRQ